MVTGSRSSSSVHRRSGGRASGAAQVGGMLIIRWPYQESRCFSGLECCCPKASASANEAAEVDRGLAIVALPRLF